MKIEMTAECARKMLAKQKAEEADKLKTEQEIANRKYAIRESELGSKWAKIMESEWEDAVKKAIKEKKTRIEMFRYYFDIDRYIAFNSKEVRAFCESLKALGYKAWTVTWNTEDYGSRSDPDYYCEGRREAYLIIDWSGE